MEQAGDVGIRNNVRLDGWKKVSPVSVGGENLSKTGGPGAVREAELVKQPPVLLADRGEEGNCRGGVGKNSQIHGNIKFC